MKSSRIAFGAVLLALACQVPKTISQENPFVKFTVSGTFDNSDKLALSGWFIVNENNGLVVRADLFHGSAEFASLPVGQGQEGGDFFLSQSNSHLDTLNLIFPAPGKLFLRWTNAQLLWRGPGVCRVNLESRPCAIGENLDQTSRRRPCTHRPAQPLIIDDRDHLNRAI